MNLFKQISILTLSVMLLALLPAPAHAQAAIPTTTLTASLTNSPQNSLVCLASTTNILSSQGNYGGIFVDLEYMTVTGAPVNSCVPVFRGQQGTTVRAHANAQTVWIDQFQINGLDSGFKYGDAQQPPYGPCTRTNEAILPRIYVGLADPFAIVDCPATTPTGTAAFGSGRWTPYAFERAVFIPPGSCAWSTTGTYASQVAVATGGPNVQGLTIVGASNVPVNQLSVTAATSANTLSCWLSADVFQPLLNKGAIITSYDTLYGVQTTTLTSINGASVGTIAFPAPAATETPSVVTPVAAGGSLTTSSTTGNMATVTAGKFYNLRTTLGTPLNLSTDLTAVVFSLVFNQSASSAEILNSPGMLVHYTYTER